MKQKTKENLEALGIGIICLILCISAALIPLPKPVDLAYLESGGTIIAALITIGAAFAAVGFYLIDRKMKKTNEVKKLKEENKILKETLEIKYDKKLYGELLKRVVRIDTAKEILEAVGKIIGNDEPKQIELDKLAKELLE